MKTKGFNFQGNAAGVKALVRSCVESKVSQLRVPVKMPYGTNWMPEVPPVLGKIRSKHPKRGKFGVFVRRELKPSFVETDLVVSPYGNVGDQLYLRESWAWAHQSLDADETIERGIVYAADHSRHGFVWKPSVHLPEHASRVRYEITDVRVERLLDVSEEDALKSGVMPVEGQQNRFKFHLADYASAREAHKAMWSVLRGNAYVRANPLMWVYDVKEIGR